MNDETNAGSPQPISIGEDARGATVRRRARPSPKPLAAVEVALRDSEARYRQLVESLPVAFYATDGHGRLTLYNDAAKSTDRPRAESVRLVVDEWLDAWLRTRATYPYVQHMEALAGACYDALRSPGEEADRRVRETFADLEHACVANGTTLADEMAWRSGCAHGWWADVHPAPDAPEYRPEARRDTPLWQRGCPPHCLG